MIITTTPMIQALVVLIGSIIGIITTVKLTNYIVQRRRDKNE